MKLANVLCIRIVFAVACCATSVISGDRCIADELHLSSVRQQCETIVKDSLRKALPEHEQNRALRISLLGQYPPEWVEGTLLTALSDKSSAVRLEAAEVLSRIAAARLRRAILKSVGTLTAKDELSRSRVAVIRLRLDQPGALKEVRRWAALRIELAGVGAVWGCSMHPQFKSANKGRCPICSLGLVSLPGRPRFVQRKAQRFALAALADRKDSMVPAMARQLISSDAEAYWRVLAACSWARVAPKDALPHIRVFLDSPDDHVAHTALEFLAKHLSKESADVFRAVLRRHREPSFQRLLAIRGLLAAGHKDFLKEVRSLLADRNDKDLLVHDVFRILGDFGEEADLRMLEPLLDTEYKESAARAMLQILDRLSQHER